ncbi:heme exporter protein CcmB [Paucibacter sp. TC2R-5]|uniref:heme exporter protein CcmB n=1 Tax=Paucibacter sp. TC2R-5 TaxID=2893555 RepID=UPI0021E4D30D|nr:heme exporter protein CcmB [Paucibacter sp. TC2R-5]MCV2361280.1 heme exporter protein CcmB [Paucibacter sp. TC2R-5]
MSNHFFFLLRRELLLAWRRPAELLGGLFFFVMVASLFPLAVGAQPELLRQIAPGVLWVAALLASLIALPRLFAADWADGTLEQLLLTPQPTVLLVLAKGLAHWLLAGLPLLLLVPLLSLQFDLASDVSGVLWLSLLLGTPVLSQIGAIGAALSLGARGGPGGGVLLALLVLPLYIPALIFGAGAPAAVQAGLSAEPHLYLLAALFLTVTALSPWATAAALRIALE